VVLTEGLGPRRLERLQAILPDPLDWPSAGDETLRSAGLDDALIRTLRRPDPNAMQRCLRWLEADHHWLITRDDPLYPPLLQRIPDPPLALFVAGQPDVLVRPQIAIVGSRSATRGGLDHAGSFAHRLARAGFVITSGLAAGVDGAAHRGCLDAGGQTIAVAGTGPDRVYPARHRRLADDILEGGALISSFPPGTPPLPGSGGVFKRPATRPMNWPNPIWKSVSNASRTTSPSLKRSSATAWNWLPTSRPMRRPCLAACAVRARRFDASTKYPHAAAAARPVTCAS